jgi:hypothetical protein
MVQEVTSCTLGRSGCWLGRGASSRGRESMQRARIRSRGTGCGLWGNDRNSWRCESHFEFARSVLGRGVLDPVVGAASLMDSATKDMHANVCSSRSMSRPCEPSDPRSGSVVKRGCGPQSRVGDVTGTGAAEACGDTGVCGARGARVGASGKVT